MRTLGAVLLLSAVGSELNAQASSRAEWNLLVERSSALYQAGKPAESEAGYRRALAEAQSLSIDPASIAIVWRYLGVAYWQLGRFAEAESAHKRALAELKRLPPEDRRVIILSAEMLQFYIRTNQIAKAERFEKQCSEAAWWMSSSSQMAHVLNAVGMLRFAQRRFDEAEALFTEASSMEQRSTPDPALRTDLSANFAALYFSTSRAGEAVRLFQRALDEERSRSGSRSPTLVTHLHNLALSYEAMGRNDEAAGILQQAFSIADESYPRSHPVRVELLGSYARVLKSLHRNKEAKVATRQAREIAHNTATLGGSGLLVDIADFKKSSVDRQKEPGRLLHAAVQHKRHWEHCRKLLGQRRPSRIRADEIAQPLPSARKSMCFTVRPNAMNSSRSIGFAMN